MTCPGRSPDLSRCARWIDAAGSEEGRRVFPDDEQLGRWRMTPAELKAAGWEEYTDAFSRGDWLICNGADPFSASRLWIATLVYNPAGLPVKVVGRGIASTRDVALERLADDKMPDGRTVREWALSPP